MKLCVSMLLLRCKFEYFLFRRFHYFFLRVVICDEYYSVYVTFTHEVYFHRYRQYKSVYEHFSTYSRTVEVGIFFISLELHHFIYIRIYKVIGYRKIVVSYFRY